MRWGLVAAAMVLGGLVSTLAQAAPQRSPELLSRDYSGRPEGTKPARALRISRLIVEVDVLGAMAWTTVTAQIANPGDERLEGDFTLDLPAGSVVTGYALDVEGRMIDGVLEAPRKARRAYEANVRAAIDPGLAEVTRENAFRTRVYPILAGKGRTLRLAFATPFDAARPYRLPLHLPEAADAVTIVVRSPEPGRTVAVGGDLPLEFHSLAGGAESRATLARAPLTGALELRPLGPPSRPTLSGHRTGETFFDLTAEAADEPVGAGRLRIYWDASRSRADDDHKAEIALVQRYVAEARPAAVSLVVFSDEAAAEVAAPTDPDALAVRLGAVAYRGATSYRALAEPGAAAADTCLLVSDGRPSLDAYAPRNLGCRLFAISSSKDANGPLLGAFARASGGAWLDLSARGSRELLWQAIRGGATVASVADATGRPVPFVALPAPRGRARIVGPAPAGGTLAVRLSNGTTKVYGLPPQAAAHDGAGAIWGASRVADLAATDRPDPAAVVALARRYSVASDQASFVVLEDADDYAEAGIPPPATLGEEALADYAAERRRIEAAEAARRNERLDDVVRLWADQKAWWATRFDPKAKPPRPEKRAGAQGVPTMDADAAAAPAPPPRAGAAPAEIEEVVTTASRAAPAITIEVTPWSPDRPYLTALRAAPPDRFWAVYEAQAKRYGDLPAYYLDVAEMLFRGGRAADARRVVTEAVEVPAADAATFVTVADRLSRYGDEDRAFWAYERLVFLEPERPQPLRNLALALIARAERPGGDPARARADYARALDLLAKVVLTPWDGDFNGIEVIALMEANRIIPKLQALGGKASLDPRLVALLDVDLRVVLEWNTEATDMDLWVDQPNGERAYYGHRATVIGGRMSDDMTGGYGPEEYLLRRAADGTYEIRVDVYATDRLNPNGSTSVRATLFRSYGRPDEARETLDLELTGKEDEALVGRIQVKGR